MTTRLFTNRTVVQRGPVKMSWDMLDIEKLLNASLDGFAVQFYGKPFHQLKPSERARIVRTIKSNCAERLTTSGGQCLA